MASGNVRDIDVILNGGYDAEQGGAVTSVNGMVGDVQITKKTLGLENVDNTSDLDKPISKATQTALNAKANTGDLTDFAKKDGSNVTDVWDIRVTRDAYGNRIDETYVRKQDNVRYVYNDNFDYRNLDQCLDEGVYYVIETDTSDDSGIIASMPTDFRGKENCYSVLYVEEKKFNIVDEEQLVIIQTLVEYTNNNIYTRQRSKYVWTEWKGIPNRNIYGDTHISLGRKADTDIGDYSVAEGLDTTASSYCSHAEGIGTTASEYCAHAEGESTIASEHCAHAEGYETTASGGSAHAEGGSTTAEGNMSHAEGSSTRASGSSSHSEGYNTKASANCAHSEGMSTEASGTCAHSEGQGTHATDSYSHAEGNYCNATNTASHAEGMETTASGVYAHAEGNLTEAIGSSSHAEGYSTKAESDYSHAEGNTTKAIGEASHAEGYSTTANETASHAEGYMAKAMGMYSHAEGYYTQAETNQHATGHFNNSTTAQANSTTGTSNGTAFVIGNGTGQSRANAFRVTGEGKIYATNASVNTGADYAEYFEWADGNPNKEDRVGYFVTFDENNPEKIRIANEGDYILGIVSGMPSVIGNGDECWKQRYVLDDFGRYIEETFEYEIEEIDAETGEKVTVTKTGTKWKENPDYDEAKEYVPRSERAEWSAIGMMGVLSVYDDGTCQVNGYCKCTNNGVATATEERSGYRVIKRVTDNIVKVIMR